MKNRSFLITVLISLFTCSVLNGQTFKSLFINDNSVFSYNTDTVLSGLNSTGYTYDIFNTRDSLRSPSFSELAPYDLLIWYCSTDGVGNYLWYGNDTDNTDLMAFLENGGYLWLMGNDFLYDRYSTPYTFSEGEFAYDYLGIWEYFAQSYGDDGGIGVSELDLLEPSYTSLNTIQWIFPTAWWVDACNPIPSAVSIYAMGPGTYPLSGYSSAISYADNGHLVMSFFFDPALMDTYANRVQLFKDILDYFQLFSGKKEKPEYHSQLQIFPNPASSSCQIMLPWNFKSENSQIRITNSLGQKMVCSQQIANGQVQLDVSSFSAGLYTLSIQSGDQHITGRLLVR